ncbi:Arv1-domain-containing protein [Schizophyllum commune H4-8]|uniref:Arv1-domain-containing protein n=1 Tax=Schizophyllum commune (strain H4-8 / FGSC 9210) TaxID=578458 RepID=UPI00215E525E|nr:Arv1-domain-containing protein [Schizophyllum commune H4-8]KAI5892627.1 Arv1-domain-containing protein [Schizophyllum commune H4-8]
MPICTTCTAAVPFLYTVYESAYNLRLEECTHCHAFADPYVEHDTLALVLDLILLKRGVFRHLLYNRGTGHRREAGKSTTSPEKATERDSFAAATTNEGSAVPAQSDHSAKALRDGEREARRWMFVARLGLPLIAADAFIRWCHLNPGQPYDESPWTQDNIRSLTRAFLGCAAETIAFHLGVTLSCFVAVRALKAYDAFRQRAPSDVRQEFRCSLVPLTLFYSSLTKLFLLFMLTIWKPSPASPASDYAIGLPKVLRSNDGARQIFHLLDDDRIDREWVVRNVLGGMSAGFGLRVILAANPFVTTLVILIGWAVKTAMAQYVSAWMGEASEAWLAYSIP